MTCQPKFRKGQVQNMYQAQTITNLIKDGNGENEQPELDLELLVG